MSSEPFVTADSSQGTIIKYFVFYFSLLICKLERFSKRFQFTFEGFFFFLTTVKNENLKLLLVMFNLFYAKIL